MSPNVQTLYDHDYYLWLNTTINQLQTGKFSHVDLDNLVEELEDMGRSQKRSVKSLSIQIFVHLLKLTYWDSARERNIGHWQGEIRTFRRELRGLINDSPSLHPYFLGILQDCYTEARLEAIARTQLPCDIFPVEIIGSGEQILDQNWFPR